MVYSAWKLKHRTLFHVKPVRQHLKIGCGHFEVDHEMMEYSQACATNWKKIPFQMNKELFCPQKISDYLLFPMLFPGTHSDKTIYINANGEHNKYLGCKKRESEQQN